MLARAEIAPHVGADDIIQNIFLRASSSLRSFDPERPFAVRRWLRRSALSMVIEAKRAHCRQKREGARGRLTFHLVASAPRPDAPPMFAPARTPSSECGRTEAAETLRRALHELSENERRVLELRFVEGRTEDQIAQRIGHTRGKIRRLLARALGRLSWSRPLRRAFLGDDRVFEASRRAPSAAAAPTECHGDDTAGRSDRSA